MSSCGLLTRKQSWRKHSKVIQRREHDFLYHEGIREISGEYRTRSKSEQSIGGLLSIYQFGRLWATSNNLIGREDIKTSNTVAARKVTFQTLVRVVLIPSREEYSQADLHCKLWWTDSDYVSFKLSAVFEVKQLMLSRCFESSQQAIQTLYQPGFDVDDVETVRPPFGCPSNAQCCPPAEDETMMRLIEAHTDVDLTDLKRHHAAAAAAVCTGTTEDYARVHVHPLALMCQ